MKPITYIGGLIFTISFLVQAFASFAIEQVFPIIPPAAGGIRLEFILIFICGILAGLFLGIGLTAGSLIASGVVEFEKLGEISILAAAIFSGIGVCLAFWFIVTGPDGMIYGVGLTLTAAFCALFGLFVAIYSISTAEPEGGGGFRI